MSQWYQMDFPDPSSEPARMLYCYHDTVLVIVMMVLFGVGWFLILVLVAPFMKGLVNRDITNSDKLEVAWTLLPSFFLVAIGSSSLLNLYEMEVGDNVGYNVSVTGHQWYWEYNYILDLDEFTKDSDYIYFSLMKDYCNEIHEVLKNYLAHKQITVSPDEMMTSLMKYHPGSFVSAYYFSLLLDFVEIHSEYFKAALSHAFYTQEAGKGYYTVLKMTEVTLEDFRRMGDSLMELVYKGVMVKWEESDYKGESKICEKVFSVTGPWELGLWEICLKGEWFLKYDSYMVPDDSLSSGESKVFGMGGFRSQEVSDPCYLCCDEKNEVLVSTADVIHSWGVLELGVKIDTIPGRVSAVSVEPCIPGVFYGFCYELCGPGHSEMPICVIVLLRESLMSVMNWMVVSSESFKEILKDSVSFLKGGEVKDWSLPLRVQGIDGLPFGKVFTLEYPDVIVYNLLFEGSYSMELCPELKYYTFSCVFDWPKFTLETLDVFSYMNENNVEVLGGQAFMLRLLCYLVF
uniref:Cytochrome c oxidase subunit 2 n=5 Tax=Ruditapes philippinarum TaxID=129788 RepID=A0A8A5N594_RUDPH|nr:cytochrome c oxidase subunit II [Ruditapes philippinarum]